MIRQGALRAWAAVHTSSGSMTPRTPKLFGCKKMAAAMALALSITLAGCGGGGFQPLYATGATGERTDERFALLDITSIPGRVGQRIRNELVFERTSAAGQALKPTKRVEIKLTETLLTNGVQVSGDSTSQTYQVEAVYRIVDIATGKQEAEGRSVNRANFERFKEIYSNIRAREDAENRAARGIAADIKTRLAVHLSRGS
jgi:LPS-assembly lipoprotein